MAGFLTNTQLFARVMKHISFEYRFIFLYALLGAMWIALSDKLLLEASSGPDMFSAFQTYKGWFYVGITSILFFIVLRRHLKKIRDAEKRAKESDNLKAAFLRNISHEIRTPMNSIMGFSSLLILNNLPDDKKIHFLRIINDSSVKLLTTVNEILDISMLQAGSLHVVEKKVDTNKLLKEIHSFFSPVVNKEVEFTFCPGFGDNKSLIMTDELKLRKVLSNIINNSLKFTEKGQITFGYVLKNDDLEFYVSDTGKGIPAEFQPHIFSGFQKYESGVNRFFDGPGLGLSISKGIIDLMKGRIWVESPPGQGSVIRFTIPYKPAHNE